MGKIKAYIDRLTTTSWRRFALATALWFAFWPIFYLVKMGDIIGPQAFHWITGAMNYPAAMLVFMFSDSILSHFKLRPWLVFIVSAAIAAFSVQFYYHRVGFTLGVFADAWLF